MTKQEKRGQADGWCGVASGGLGDDLLRWKFRELTLDGLAQVVVGDDPETTGRGDRLQARDRLLDHGLLAIERQQLRSLLEQLEEARRAQRAVQKDASAGLRKRDPVSFARNAAAKGKVQQLERQVDAYHADGTPKKLAMAVRSKSAHYRMAHIQRRHWNAVAKANGLGEDFEPVIQQSVTQTPRVVEAVSARLPAGFPAGGVQFAFAGSIKAARCFAYSLESNPCTGTFANRGSAS